MSTKTDPKKIPVYKNPLETQSESQQQAMEHYMRQEQMGHKAPGVANPEFSNTVFTFHEHHESKDRHKKIENIQHLIEEVKHEAQEIRRHSEGVTAEVDNIEKIALQSLPDKPGVYHIRYLEMILSFLQGIKAKVGEAKTWLSAMQSKKAKRGSAFVTRSKKQGTAYSLSQEHQVARNVQ
ncbi:hypothetical protein A3F34_02100 [Candidatus Roizmanbacteria bacterium RIFCSPHIGHO2_12_FULL_44_10]|uniref:DUF5660 domain-containing protein n=1 Tax=Candidatus Roizmanbacteria bacterium RIFCSPHIGHO2_12_FULL_44_10 TaxID=1802054 RepID=A0A1F7I6C6_9BACT|nr:MAG: hypothetical protein A3F34_02100 [Candidatus Roizmanbacteria bacterium RIFCSPHIGHO2_12_FULL_44_10]